MLSIPARIDMLKFRALSHEFESFLFWVLEREKERERRQQHSVTSVGLLSLARSRVSMEMSRQAKGSHLSSPLSRKSKDVSLKNSRRTLKT